MKRKLLLAVSDRKHMEKKYGGYIQEYFLISFINAMYIEGMASIAWNQWDSSEAFLPFADNMLQLYLEGREVESIKRVRGFLIWKRLANI